MQESIFVRSVVLVCHHDTNGSFGLIVNKPAANPFEGENHALHSFPFFAGGPVDINNMFFIHNLMYLPDCLTIKDGLCWQGSYDALMEAVAEKAFRPDNGRLMIGYTGWGEGQLEEEIANEDWMVYNGPIQGLLDLDPETTWKTLLQKMGPYYKMVSNFPTDPHLN